MKRGPEQSCFIPNDAGVITFGVARKQNGQFVLPPERMPFPRLERIHLTPEAIAEMKAGFIKAMEEADAEVNIADPRIMLLRADYL